MVKTQRATFGMGCFWGPQALFDKVDGVVKTEVGYMGGDERKYPKPSYEDVCSDKTEYAEVVQVEFDSKKISYKKLLDTFWENHNPVTKNRQGPDMGSQYRSVIFYHDDKQKKEAEESKKKMQKELGSKKIVTEIVKAGKFVRAEEYHQKYLKKTGRNVC
jgi:peptide-methionine (S)-S-oxide reductase